MMPRRRILLALALLARPAAAEPARLRRTVQLEASVIRVGDLWDNAGPNAERVLGPAPEPGRHIVVERRQLEHIARLHGVDWRGESAADRAIVETPGRAVPRELVMQRLQAALMAAGATADAIIEVPELALPMVPPDVTPEVGVEEARIDGAGRFTAVLLIGAGGPTRRLRVAGRAIDTRPVVVAARRLPAGTALAADDVRVERWPVLRARAEHAPDPAPLIGRTLRRALAAGQPVPAAELTALAAVTPGQEVTVTVEATGLSLTLQGVAMGSGAAGDRVTVRNPATGATFPATVLGAGRVRAELTDRPALAAGRAR
jgi:flagella basal body P-ring formation protein FlgA